LEEDKSSNYQGPLERRGSGADEAERGKRGLGAHQDSWGSRGIWERKEKWDYLEKLDFQELKVLR